MTPRVMRIQHKLLVNINRRFFMSLSENCVVKTHSIHCHLDWNNEALVRETWVIKPIKMSVSEDVLMVYVLTKKIFSVLHP